MTGDLNFNSANINMMDNDLLNVRKIAPQNTQTLQLLDNTITPNNQILIGPTNIDISSGTTVDITANTIDLTSSNPVKITSSALDLNTH